MLNGRLTVVLEAMLKSVNRIVNQTVMTAIEPAQRRAFVGRRRAIRIIKYKTQGSRCGFFDGAETRTSKAGECLRFRRLSAKKKVNDWALTSGSG